MPTRRLFSLPGLFLAGLVLAISVPSSSRAQDEPTVDVAPVVLEAQEKRVAVIERVAPSVVAIFGPGGGGGGSGVLISKDGYALTNFHVTSGAGDWMKCGLNDGKLYDAVIVSIDPTGDVALIKLLGRDDFPTSPMGDSDKVEVGDWTYAMGNPFLLATDFQPTVTYGIVSGVNRYQYPAGTILEYTDCIQIDTSINPGNSGGPLFNEDGEVIGINGRGSFEKRGRVNSGAGYAISINQIKYFMGHLKSGRLVDHASLGATVYNDTSGLVRVEYVSPRSEAARRGLQPEDEIISFGGRGIRSVNQFKNILGIYPNGWTIPLTIRRGDTKKTLYVKLDSLHTRSEMEKLGKSDGQPPKPDDKPEDEKKPGDGDGEKKPKKIKPIQMMKRGPKPPKEYAHMLEKRPGFTNYYFNELRQKELLESLGGFDGFSGREGTWKLTGSLTEPQAETPVPFDLRMTPKVVLLKTGEVTQFQDLVSGEIKDLPENTGGLLIGMHHLNLLLQSGGKGFTEFFYFGSEPLDGQKPMVEVLIGELTGVRTHFYLDQESGRLVGFDTYLLEGRDPCEVRFDGVQTTDTLTVPKTITVSHADEQRFTFAVDATEILEAK